MDTFIAKIYLIYSFITLFSVVASLYDLLMYVKEQFSRKRDGHLALSVLYSNRLTEWNQKDHLLCTENYEKQVDCVYRISGGKGMFIFR